MISWSLGNGMKWPGQNLRYDSRQFHDNSRFVGICWNWLWTAVNSTEQRLSSCSSTPQHSISASESQYELTSFDSFIQLPWCFIVFQTFDSLSMFNSSCCFLGMWVGIPGQSKSAKSGSVSNSSYHWTQQAENIGPLCKHRQSHGFPLSAAHPEVSQ